MKLRLIPVGNVDNKILKKIKDGLEQTFGCPSKIEKEIDNLAQAYDPRRKQYSAPVLLSILKTQRVEKDEKVLGISDIDLYAPGLNFVFGEADTLSEVAIISLHRLRQDYYGLPPDEVLFQDRATKEAIHELGHTFGLGHCPDTRCIMQFSNTLADTDWKLAVFCNQCHPKLIR